jgi:hypothetical protein
VRFVGIVWCVALACTPLQSNVPRVDARADGACASGVLDDDANCGSCGRRCATGDVCMAGECVAALGASRPLAPLTGASVRSTRPTLRWALAEGADGVRAELCRDRAMTEGCVASDLSGVTGAPGADLAPGVWFWRVTSRAGAATSRAVSPTWALRVASVDSAKGSTLDTDGDGRVEVAIAAPRAYGGAGRVYLYEGVTEGSTLSLVTTRRGTGTMNFGQSLAHAGDVNRDGYADLLVGTLEGNRASLYLGGQGALAATPTVLQGGDALARFGVGVAGVGDVNGDGFDDIAVAARSADGAPGLARVFHGGGEGITLEPAVTLTTRGATSLDVTVASAGDVNGDGFADVALGVDGASGGAGVVHVFHGGASGLEDAPAVTLAGADLLGSFGSRLAPAGDVNGDGYGDLFVAAPEAMDQRGRVSVFYGGPRGLSAVAATTLLGRAARARLGYGVASGADLDGDGFTDLITSEPGYPANLGSVLVFRGGAEGIARTPWRTRDGVEGADSAFGFMLLPVDLNFDGRVDLVVTAVGAGSNHGRAHVYLGEPGDLARTPLPVSGLDGAQAVFGWAIAGLWAPRPRVDAFCSL